MYRILHIISSFMCSMPKRRVDMKFSRGGSMMKQQKLKRKMLLGIGSILFSFGLILSNFYSDIQVFPNMNKGIGISVLIVGILCLVASNFYRKSSPIR